MCALCLIGMAALSAAQEGMEGEGEDVDVVHLFGEELESSEAESSSSEQEEGTSAHDACTTCGEVDEFFPQYCSRHPSFAHAASSFAPCSGNVELCGRCFDAKLKMSCVKCQRWDCHECQAFDKDAPTARTHSEATSRELRRLSHDHDHLVWKSRMPRMRFQSAQREQMLRSYLHGWGRSSGRRC